MFSRKFFRWTAVCSILAAIGVLIAQIGLSAYPQPSNTDEAIALYTNTLFRAQSWTILVQVFLMLLALWGVTVKMYSRTPALIATGFLFFIIWQLFELIPRSVDLFTLSYDWAPRYLAAANEATRLALVEYFRLFGDVSDAIREVRRVMWALGHLLFGLAIWPVGGWKRVIAILFLLNTARLVLSIIGGVLGLSWLTSGGVALFIVLMVPLFLLIGVWLWKEPKAE